VNKKVEIPPEAAVILNNINYPRTEILTMIPVFKSPRKSFELGPQEAAVEILKEQPLEMLSRNRPPRKK